MTVNVVARQKKMWYDTWADVAEHICSGIEVGTAASAACGRCSEQQGVAAVEKSEE